MQKLQNRAARIVTGSSFDTPGLPLIKKLGWKTIDQLPARLISWFLNPFINWSLNMCVIPSP